MFCIIFVLNVNVSMLVALIVDGIDIGLDVIYTVIQKKRSYFICA